MHKAHSYAFSLAVYASILAGFWRLALCWLRAKCGTFLFAKCYISCNYV